MVVTARSGERQRFHRHVSEKSLFTLVRLSSQFRASKMAGAPRQRRLPPQRREKRATADLKPPIAPTGARDTRASIEAVMFIASSVILTCFFMAFVPRLFPRSVCLGDADEST
jgi:hypothetical protein